MVPSQSSMPTLSDDIPAIQIPPSKLIINFCGHFVKYCPVFLLHFKFLYFIPDSFPVQKKSKINSSWLFTFHQLNDLEVKKTKGVVCQAPLTHTE